MSMTGDDFDLEADLNAALDGTIHDTPVQQEAREQPVEGETAAEEQARYVREGRRFVKETKEEPKDAKPVEQEAKEAPPTPAKQWKPLWYKEEYGAWEQLSEPLRRALEQRETESAQAITKHSTAAKAWEPVTELLKPHLAELQAAGVAPQQYVSNLINADKYLRQDPVQAMNWLCQQYLQTDIIGLADWMAQKGVQPQKVDPIQQELETLRQQVQKLQSAPLEQRQQQINTTVSEWSKDKPYFAELQNTIMGLIQADPGVRDRFSVDPKATLDSLYEQAQWAHPQIRERILEDRGKTEEDQRIAALKRARAAGAQSPRGGQANGAVPSYKSMTLEEEIAANLG